MLDLATEVARITDRGLEGPCAARNEALRSARSTWVLLLDDDAEPAPGCLDALLAAAAADPRIAIVSPRVVRLEDPSLIHFDGGHAHFLAELCLENAWRPLDDARAPSDAPGAVASTALLVHRERALACGLFDEGMSFFKEDLEFSLRVRAHGWLIRHAPEALVRHGRAGPAGPLHTMRTYYQTRNRWWIILKLYEPRTILLTLPAQLGYELLHLAYALRRGEGAQYARAYRDLLTRLPPLLAARRVFQRSRRVKDAQLLSAPGLSWRPKVMSLRAAPALKRACDAIAGWWWSCIITLR